MRGFGDETVANRRRDILLVVTASVAVVSLLYLTSPTVFEAEDFVKLHSLNREYLARAVRAGRLPLWNPHVGLGRPFLADVETAAFYPPNLLYLFLEPHLALFTLLAAHAGLSLAATRALARALGARPGARWLAGLAFLGCGPVVGALHRGQIPFGEATAYLPLLFLLSLRLQDGFTLRGLARLCLALALQWLCGHPQMAWMSWLGVTLFLVGRGLERSGRKLAAGVAGLALALGGAAALAAAQLFPFLELAAHGNRARPSLEFATVGSLPWVQWLSLFVPARIDGPVSLGADLYLGPLLLLAGLAGLCRLNDRNVRGLALVVLVGVLIAAGERTPAFGLFYHLIPGLSSFRFPGRMGLVACFALLMAASVLLSAPHRADRAAVATGALGLVVATVFWPAGLASLASRGLLIAVSAIVLARFRLPALVAALALGDLAVANVLQKSFRGGAGPFPGEKVVAETLREAGLLRSGAPPPRVSVPYPIIRDNAGMLWGFSSFSGFVALTLEPVWVYLHRSLGLSPPQDANTYPAAEIWRSGPFPYRTMSLVLGYDPRTRRLVRREEPDPRAYLVHAVEVVPDLAETMARLSSGHDPRRVALLASPPGSELGPEGPGRAEIIRFEPERVMIRVESRNAALLVLAEASYPGWRAFVNGREAACLRANAWMRAVVVPGGASEVVLLFRSTWLAAGAVLSALAAAATAYALRRRPGRPRSREGPPSP